MITFKDKGLTAFPKCSLLWLSRVIYLGHIQVKASREYCWYGLNQNKKFIIEACPAGNLFREKQEYKTDHNAGVLFKLLPPANA